MERREGGTEGGRGREGGRDRAWVAQEQCGA